MPAGITPAGNGEPGVIASAPVPESIWYCQTLLEVAFVTYKKVPESSTSTQLGSVPAENGEPVTSTRAPVLASIANADRLFDNGLAT